MKRILLISSLLLSASFTFAQGSIQGFTVSPASPTIIDNIVITVDLMFSNSGCAVDNQGHSTAGTATDAYGHHCIGMLSAICNTSDVFNVGTLPAGSHVFRFTLTSGSGSSPCSPGIIPDDMDSVTFMVSPAVGITENSSVSKTKIFPNPFQSSSILSIDKSIELKDAKIRISNIQGKTLRIMSGINSHQITLESGQLETGIYFYQLLNNVDQQLSAGQFVISN
ncbi:MAG: T9SS type A sorting domain-containing protein [Bacteroidota bacterium]|nr:T9SS type A sorting domain-containing protein [Bacteroidota bacterium]